MIAAVAVAGWMAAGVVAAALLGRIIREADDRQADDFEPCTCGACMSVDFLWDQPTDVLSDEAINARFNDIVGGLR